MDLFSGHAGLVDVAVAVHAPTHGERFVLPHALHRFDRTVTLLALDRGRDVRAMIEVHEIGQLVDPLPRDRLRRLSRFREQRLVEGQGVVQLLQLRRDDGSRRALLRRGGFLFLLDGRERSRSRPSGSSCRRSSRGCRRAGSCPRPSDSTCTGSSDRPRGACASRRSVERARNPGCPRGDATPSPGSPGSRRRLPRARQPSWVYAWIVTARRRKSVVHPTVPRSENAPKDTISMVSSKTHADAAVDVSALERRPGVDGPSPVHRARRTDQRVPVCLANTGEILSVDK